LIERSVLSTARPDELVIDPFPGVGSLANAAIRHYRRATGAEIDPAYFDSAEERIRQAWAGELRVRPMDKSVHYPTNPACGP
jgi:DNA modification methylase